MEQRNIYLDIAKGITIILVVLGHSIQYGSFEYLHAQFFQDPLFVAIYSFHMPLFMLISGYLFRGSICRHSFKYNIRTRFMSLLLPVIIWNSIYVALIVLQHYLEGSTIHWTALLVSYITNIWFLWAIFWSSIIVLIIHRYFYDNIVLYIVLGCIALLLLRNNNISLYIYMYPYFVVGYLWKKYALDLKFKDLHTSKKTILLLVSGLLYILLYDDFSREDYIYITGTGLIRNLRTSQPFFDAHQLGIDIFRYVIGFVGASCILMLIKLVMGSFKSKKLNTLNLILAKFGKRSLGIYIISVTFINGLILPSLPYKEHFGYLMIGIETIIFVTIPYFITIFLEKNRLTKKLMLGSR